MNRRSLLSVLAKGMIALALVTAVPYHTSVEESPFVNTMQIAHEAPAELSLESRLQHSYDEITRKFEVKDSSYVAIIAGETQKMYILRQTSSEDGKKALDVLEEYSVSTAKRGFSGVKYSDKTPYGIHRIVTKIGKHASIGEVIDKGIPTKWIVKINKGKKVKYPAFMVTRVLVLEGCEKRNHDSLIRGVCIHGTADEGLLGTPQSHGCIRMTNEGIIELYNLLPVGTYVNIIDKI